MDVRNTGQIDHNKVATERLNRLCNALRLVNQAIVRLRTRDELLHEICRIAVEDGGFALAWFGWIEAETQRVVPVARFGDHSSFLSHAPLYADDRREGCGPAGRAIRSGKPYVCNGYFHDPATLFGQGAVEEYCFWASGMFPIRLDDAVVGILAVHASTSGYFQAEEIALLVEAAADVSFAFEDFARKEEILRVQEVAPRLSMIVETANDAVISESLDGTIISWNSAAERMFGYTAEEICGLNMSILSPPERIDEEPEFLYRIMSGEQINDFETVRVRKDGQNLPVSMTISLLRSADGEVTGSSKIVRDITERKLAGTALREAEESLKEAQRIAGLGSYVLDIRAGVWTGSDVLYEVLGLDKGCEHTLGRWIDLIAPDDHVRLVAQFGKLDFDKGKLLDEECRIIRQTDQAVRWVHILGKAEFDGHRGPLSLRGTIQDITERKLAEADLRKSSGLLELFIQDVPVGVAMLNREMRYIAASQRWIEDYGLKGWDLIGRSHYELLPGIPERWKDEHRRALSGESVTADEDCFQRADGSVRWLRRLLRPWRTGSGAIGGIVILAEDITQRRDAEERLRQAASVFLHASEGIVITDTNGTIADVNDAFTRITGYTRDEALGRHLKFLNSGRKSNAFYENMWRDLLENGEWSGEIWNRKKNGQVYVETLTITGVPDAAGRANQYVALFSDITSRKEHEQQLRHIAHYDLLTGLPNRVLLAERLQHAIDRARHRGQPVAIACLDLDNFKAVNDLHGHNTGDQLLKAVAHRMKAVLREDDTLARLGGDEFVAVLPKLGSPENSASILSRLLQAVAEPVPVGDLFLQVSASVGVTFYPQADDVDADQLLRQVDQAMYQAKLKGKNRYHIFDPGLDRSVRGHHEDLERIRLALEANEFVLYYQPKVNMSSGKILGAEALIRWQHPERGILPPAQFLPIVEGHPIAVELGEWGIDTVLTQMERWHADGLDIPISVNISAQQLQQAGFIDRLGALLARHPGIAPSALELEVVESSALQNLEEVAQVISVARGLGVSFALDDFGTGYSSLTYLRRLPVDVLKIDQTFVHDMLEDPEALAIVEGVLGLATAFCRQAVAEGVETVEHGLMLLQLGCQVAQGYAIARPMPGPDLLAWVAVWHPDPKWLNASSVNPGGRPLLYASAEHRAWTLAIEAYLKGQRYAPPALGHRQCRFGAWLHEEAMAGCDGLSAFQSIDLQHQRVHELAAEILAPKPESRSPEAMIRIADLCTMRDKLLEDLQVLMQKGYRGRRGEFVWSDAVMNAG